MTSDLASVHDELRTVARDVLGAVRTRTAGSVPAPVEWSVLAELGWLGLEVPEHCAGAGASLGEVAVILQEMGRAATSSSYLGSVVLGVGALNLLGAARERDELLHGIATGGLRVAVVVPTAQAEVASAETPFRVESSGGRFRLDGQASFVPDAIDADRFLVLARDQSGDVVMVVLGRATPGLSVSEQPLLDATRRFGQLRADAVEGAQSALLRFEADPATSVQHLADRGALAIACDSLGLAEAMMEATAAYARVRYQFGRPIGSFQAVKHACADMLVQIEVSRELVGAAIDAMVRNDPDLGIAVSMAKAHVTGAAVGIVGKAMQLHGGIGYTWESGIHTYLKRALLNRSLFGSPRAHRKRLARRYLSVGTNEIAGSRALS